MDPDSVLREEAAANHGVVTRRRARERGLTDRMIEVRIRKGALIRKLPETFVLASHPPSYLQECAATLGWLGDASLLHGVSTAILLGIGGVRSSQVHVWTPRAVRDRDEVVVHRLPKGRSLGRRWHLGLATVGAEDLFLDVAHLVPGATEAVLDDLLQRRMTTMQRLATHVDGWHGHGAATAKRLLSERMRLPERLDSWLEKEFARFVREYGLPMPLTQQRFLDGRRCVARVDFLYPAEDLVIEVDGYGAHSQKQAWQRDLRRNNELVLRKLRILRYSADDLKHRAARMADEIRAALVAAERSA